MIQTLVYPEKKKKILEDKKKTKKKQHFFKAYTVAQCMMVILC